MGPTLFPPIIDSYMPAFMAGENAVCRVYFSLSKFNSLSDIESLHATVVKQDTNMNVVNLTSVIRQKNEKGEDVNTSSRTGIILNLIPQAVSGKENLYYIEIPNKALSSNVSGYSGWIPGWVYKVQLRLSRNILTKDDDADWLTKQSNNNDLSEWSTVCIVKAIGPINYTFAEPLNIDSRNPSKDNIIEDERILKTLNLDLSGRFIRTDKTELIRFYNFTLYDGDGTEIIESSNDIYANQYQDSDSINYYFKTELENGKEYKLAFKYETINKYVGGFYQTDDEDNRYSFRCDYYGIDTPPCILLTAENDASGIIKSKEKHIHDEILDEDSPEHKEPWSQYYIDPPYERLLNIEEEEEEGRVALKFHAKETQVWSGNLCIRRSDSRTNYQIWEDIYIYVCRQEDIDEIPIIYDYTVESGVAYKYAVQVIDRYGDRGAMDVTSNPVIRNFNYSFLLGKNNQQLKLKFNNDMGSFKYQVYDSKIDPLGAKYPTIARNANVYYRTFPINGLISFNMDDNKLFCTRTDIYGENAVSDYNKYNRDNDIMSVDNNYISQYDYIYERDFRNKVLDFLQDGELKLFKSPTEGNVIVRLMDVSCTPNQTLGRMIYSFTSTAFEMAESNLQNYLKYGFYSIGNWETEFDIYETRLGQISTDIKINPDSNRSDNIIELIKKKYDTSGQNVGGYTTVVSKVHHIKITFDEKPLRVKNQNGELVLGNNIEVAPNGNNLTQITVYNTPATMYSPDRIYEFDHRLEFIIDSSQLYILGMEPHKSVEDPNIIVRSDTVHVTIDFLYESTIKAYLGKEISTRESRRGIGQFFGECRPETDIFRQIYNKYYLENDYIFSMLHSLSSVVIESAPGAAFIIQDDKDESGGEMHVVGITGELQLYEINNLKKLYYLGMVNPADGSIMKQKADVLVNYLCIIQKGTYKEKKG